MQYRTPEGLINEIAHINQVQFTGESKYHTLTEFISDISRHYKCPMFADKTGPSRVTQIYRCRYGGRQRVKSSKTKCQCCVKFIRAPDGSFSFNDADWNHNHPTSIDFFDAHFNSLTKDEIEEVNFQQQLNVPSGQIRSNLGTSLNKDIFYNVRRKTIQSKKVETLESFRSDCSDPGFWSNFRVDNSGDLVSASFVHIRICNCAFAFDTIFMDDTAGSNIYDLPLEMVITVDSEGRNQILAFGLLPDRTSESYRNFMLDIKEHTGKEPRIIFTDRSCAQISAIKDVFPSSYIVYCHVHLRRDLLKYFDQSDDIIVGFADVSIHYERCEDYLQLLLSRLKDLHGKQGFGIIHSMIEGVDHWLPSKLIENGVFFKWNNNRIEGFFGCYKSQHGFSRVTAGELCKNLMSYSKLMIVESIRSRSSTIKQYDGLTCFDLEDIKSVGKLALDYISTEYLKHLKQEEIDESFCVWCNLRLKFPELSLPCRHLMNNIDEIKFTKGQLHERYLNNQLFCSLPSSEHTMNILISQTSNTPRTYTDIMAKLAPFASFATREPKILNIFEKTIEELHSVNKTLNSGMPATIALKGKLSSHPSKNVILGGVQKKKKSLYMFNLWPTWS